MKRYLLFCGSRYYPSGGMEDFEGSFDSPEDAKDGFIPELFYDSWAHVYDVEGKDFVEYYEYGKWMSKKDYLLSEEL